MTSLFREILKEFDWGDGFRIPIANDENKQLEEEIAAKAKKKKELVEKFNVTKNRIQSIDQHLKNISIERDYNQNLLSAYVSQHDAEENLYKTCENEVAVITQEIRNIEKEKENNQQRIKLMEAEINKMENKLKSSKTTVLLDESKCLQWKETLNCEEERQRLIEKYLKLDGKKFKELDLKRLKLIDELQDSHQLIQKIVGEILEKEITLDKAAKFYVQLLEERRNLIDRWTQSIVVLRQRDNCIQATFREMESLREIGMEKLKLLTELQEFIDNQNNCNKQLKDDIVKSEKRLSILKEKRFKLNTDNGNYDIELKIRRQSLNELSSKTESLQTDIKRLKERNVKTRLNINNSNTQIQDLKKTLHSINDDEITIDDRLKQLRSMLENEEKRKVAILKDTKNFQDLIHRTSAQITNYESEQKILERQKQGAIRQIELSSILESKQEKLLREKKDIIHQLDLQLCNYEMQISSYREEMDKDELERKKQIIKELQSIFDDKKNITKLLHTQIINLECDIKKVQSALNKENQELETLQNKYKNSCLMMEGSEKALKNAVKLNEEKQVAENILELRVTQVEELMHNTGTKVHNLEQCHSRIHAAMAERVTEIKILHDALNSKYKLAQNECAQLRTAIAQIHSQTLNYQARYETIIFASRIYDANRAVPTSTLSLKIKNAQNKYLLQERGDKLDATIRKTELEIKSMENTLRVVAACNENYKMSLDTDDGNDESTRRIVKQQLYEEICNARENMKQIQLQCEQVKKELLVIQDNNKSITDNLHQLQEQKEKKYRDVITLEKQITDQKGRISRADVRLKKLYKDIQKQCEHGNAENMILQEKDIIARELEELNLLALQRITEFTVRHVEAEVYVKKLLAAKNIVLPGIQHIKSTLSLGVCNDSTTNSFPSQNKGKSIPSRLLMR